MKCPNCQSDLLSNARFCGVCGSPVVAAAGGNAEAGAGVTAVPGTAIPAAAGPVVATAASSRRLWMIGGGILAVALCLVLAAVTLFAVVPRVTSRSQLILYTVNDDAPGSVANSLLVMQPDGSNSLEIIRNRNGFWLPTSRSQQTSYLAPNGRWLAVIERVGQSSDWELAVYTVDGAAPLLTDRSALVQGSFQSMGFSPDSRRFAYTSHDSRRNEVALHVIDDKGSEIAVVTDVVFSAFFPDSRRILGIQVDSDGLFDLLVWVDTGSGEVNRITSLSDSSGWIRPLVTADSRKVYFYADEELLAVDVSGGAGQRIYTFESQTSSTFFSPDQNYLAIYDQFSNSDRVGELRLVTVANNNSARIDRDVNLAPRSNLHGGESYLDFAPNGRHIAYLTGEIGDIALYVNGIDGRDRKRISNGNYWVTFAFSPDSRQIAYIEGRGQGEPGSLYVSNIDGGNRLRLDTDVWSFRYAPDGRTLVYSKISGLSRGRVESEIFRIRPNGQRQEVILEAQRGLITLLAWTK
jgi:Tol biopolymer transport system component